MESSADIGRWRRVRRDLTQRDALLDLVLDDASPSPSSVTVLAVQREDLAPTCEEDVDDTLNVVELV